MRRVEEFHDKFGMAVTQPYSDELFNLRMRLIAEEFKELAEAGANVVLGTNDEEPEQIILREKFLKEVCDCVYVMYGVAVSFGWDFEEAFNRVHQSNMTKTGSKEDGKQLKGEGYIPPDLKGCVE